MNLCCVVVHLYLNHVGGADKQIFRRVNIWVRKWIETNWDHGLITKQIDRPDYEIEMGMGRVFIG